MDETRDGAYVSLKEAARAARLPESTLRQWIRQGKLTAISAGSDILIPKTELQRVAPLSRPGKSRASREIVAEAVFAEDIPPATNDGSELPAEPQIGSVIVERLWGAYARLLEEKELQIAAKNDVVAAKDEMIRELRRRAEYAEAEVERLRRKRGKKHW